MQSAKKPWLITSRSYEWPSCAIFVPTIVEMFQGIGAKVRYVDPSSVLDLEKLSNDISRGASCLVLTSPLSETLSLAVKLRERFGLKIPVIVYDSCHMVSGGLFFYYHKKFFTRRDALVAPSTPETALLKKSFCNTISCETIPYPVNQVSLRVPTQLEKKEQRRKNGLPENAQILTYVGRLTPKKNIHNLLRSFAIARKKKSDLVLCLVGEFQRDDYKSEIFDLIDILKIKNSVFFTGAKPHVKIKSYLRASDALISLSLYPNEEFGYAIAEGLACGIPTIVSRWGGGVDFVAHGAALGIDIKLNKNTPDIDVNLAANKILEILEPFNRKKWSKNALEFAKQHLHKDRVKENWLKLIEKCVSQNQKTEPVKPHAEFNQINSSLLLALYLQSKMQNFNEPKWRGGVNNLPQGLSNHKFFQAVSSAYSGDFDSMGLI